MFLRWGAACSRAHLVSACTKALASGHSQPLSLARCLAQGLARSLARNPARGLALSVALCLALCLPHGLAFAAADSVFVHGTGAPSGAAPTSPTLGGQPNPGFTSPTLTPAVQTPAVQTPTVQSPSAPAPASPAAPQVSPLTAPGVPAPAQAQQPQSPPVPGAPSPAAPAAVGQPVQAVAPAVQPPQKPEPPAKDKSSRGRKDKKSKKGKEEEPQEKTAPVEAPAPRAAAPAPQKSAPPTQAEEAAMAYAKGDYATAESIWRKHAEAGDGQAMNNLGVLYDLGQGVEPDMGRALHWFAESAKTGHPSGMSNYGRMLEQGRGIEANPAEAARWFDLAARQGQPEAQYNLGMLYELGRGVSQDFKAAAAWYSRAAAQQQTEALFRLGHFYRIGQGVTKNPARAVLLLYAAAMNGEPNAMKDLEDMARAEPARPEAVLFGQRLDNTDRNSMRAALRQYGATVTREDNAYICDLYDAARVAPGARQMAICYGPGDPAPLGFLELDYAAPDNSIEGLILKMVTDRFGPASAGEGDDARLWNLGSVVVATRYEPTRGQFSLMYMVPRVYHLTRQR